MGIGRDWEVPGGQWPWAVMTGVNEELATKTQWVVANIALNWSLRDVEQSSIVGFGVVKVLWAWQAPLIALGLGWLTGA